ncbi:MAG: SDR family oxidoreductase [Xanthomonadales bacterium]|nr:SDR family oxidoreductase [Xanthomonadales bacterium]
MKTVFITGANRGIGLEMAKQFSQKGVQVIAACRNSSPELDQLNIQVETHYDVADADSVRQLAEKFKQQKIDILINNAGILDSMGLGDLNYDSMRRQFEINALGPLRVSQSFLPNLDKGSKIVIITSRMGSMQDNTSGGQYGYRMSKAAVNMVGRSLAEDLKQKEIAVALLHPGYVRTEMTAGNGLINADESARGLIQRIDELNMHNTGGFWHTDGTKLPW